MEKINAIVPPKCAPCDFCEYFSQCKEAVVDNNVDCSDMNFDCFELYREYLV